MRSVLKQWEMKMEIETVVNTHTHLELHTLELESRCQEVVLHAEKIMLQNDATDHLKALQIIAQ